MEVLEANGDFALRLFSSPWCRRLDAASRDLCATSDNAAAIRSGRWHCLNDCLRIGRSSMDAGEPADSPCAGGIRILAVPVRSEGRVVGSFVFGYGDPPQDEKDLRRVAERYGLSVDELRGLAKRHPFTPPPLLAVARSHLTTLARLAGDVVERWRAAEGARKSADEFRALFESSPDALVVTDQSGAIVRVTSQTESLFGYSPSEIVGQPVEVLLPERFRGSHLEHRARYSSDPRVRPMGRQVELYGRRKNGDEIPVAISLSPIRIDGEILVAAAIRDMTERKRAEAALRVAEEKYRTLVEQTPAITYILQPGWPPVLSYISPQVASLGFGAEEFLRDPDLWFRQVHPEDRAWVRAEAELCRSTGKRFRAEYRFETRAGRIVWLHNDASLARDEAGVPLFVQGLIFDVTEQKRAEERLRRALEKAEEADRLKSEFLANISHEVRTPLNVITGFASLIDEHLQEIGDHSHDELLEGLRGSSKRLLDTIHGLLDLASIETGAFSPTPKRIELSSFLQEQIDRLAPAARGKGLSLDLEVEESGAEVTFDPYCLTRVLENLLDNAIKFTERGGVTVRIHRDEGGALCLSVRDTGVGIDPSYARHLFERFSQEESGHTRHFEGAGIGLALVKRYVEMNQAEISFQSEKGRGSTFRIRFAVAPVASLDSPG
ncbi:MAG: PAS domain S-box protein [Deltaproteobacteria bacterium]|nr:PAS domain S-box protein [Deltaproteobacteria bacterium]